MSEEQLSHATTADTGKIRSGNSITKKLPPIWFRVRMLWRFLAALRENACL
jgi:hypothetical protein